MSTFTAYVEWDEEAKMYVGVVPGVPGAHSQAPTLDELQRNMKEVLELCLEEHAGPKDFPHFVGLQQIEGGFEPPARPLVREILREIELAPEEFIKALSGKGA